MTHPYYHAKSSAKLFGGKPEDYVAIHSWFDATKGSFADFGIVPCAIMPKASLNVSAFSASPSRTATTSRFPSVISASSM